MDNEFNGLYRPYWEHTIYIPVAVYQREHVKRIAAECGGCTVYHAVGGSWVSPDGDIISEPVNVVQATTRYSTAPLAYHELHRELRAAGEQAVLITRRQIEWAVRCTTPLAGAAAPSPIE